MSLRDLSFGRKSFDKDAPGQSTVKDIEEVVIKNYDDEPYYFASDDNNNQTYHNEHNIALRLKTNIPPSVKSLVETVLDPRTNDHIMFEQSMYVEYRSNDMRWKVGLVNRVLRQPPDNWDFDLQGEIPESKLEIYYNVGVEGVVSTDNIRAPKLGLQAVFGKRPWLWQQLTLLQLERRLRFDENHEYDFDEIDNLEFATSRYDDWLESEKNQDFKEWHDAQPVYAQQMLRSHLMTPFDMLDFITERKDEWDFDDPAISVYTYLGVLGSGVLLAVAILVIQVGAPLVLLYNAILLSDGDPNPRFFVDNDTGLPENGNFFPGTDFNTFCLTDSSEDFPGRIEGKILVFFVILLYLVTVIPDSMLTFFHTSGGADTTYSKINSLREIIWAQNDDDIQQQIGYKLDRFMNTGYIALLYSIMLFILINTPLPLDIILNALAIEFIHEIDERLANAEWWDGGNRWIRAGTMELVLQGNLRLRVLESRKQICDEFGIDPEVYNDAMGKKSLCNATQAKLDDKNQRFMSRKERIYDVVAEQAKNEGNAFVEAEYRKSIEQFGISGKTAVFFRIREKGMFHRYTSYRVWSLWEKVLFLPAVPSEDTLFAAKTDERNADVTFGKSDYREFFVHVTSVLLGLELLRSVQQCITYGNLGQVPIRIFMGLLEIFFYIMQLLFPVLTVGFVAFFPYCY
eukprot:augustus_masked-scaffold_7-processed-gene-7.51-mRNA-1 protein AED:0.04 eAED:0.04 QI:0/-1/0/1/-1/1/1/0/683